MICVAAQCRRLQSLFADTRTFTHTVVEGPGQGVRDKLLANIASALTSQQQGSCKPRFQMILLKRMNSHGAF